MLKHASKSLMTRFSGYKKDAWQKGIKPGNLICTLQKMNENDLHVLMRQDG
jgi:hypothetical protein